MKKSIFIFTLLLFIFSCKEEPVDLTEKDSSSTLFAEVPSATSNVAFNNRVIETYEFNFLSYPYIYIGGGVAIGDINNDGLQDMYFSANQGQNKLYLNKGNFEFQDITVAAGVPDEQGWSTGVSMIDINNDGWLDMYVCKSASLKSHDLRRNKLFINQKNNTFIESAKAYGLDHPGFSTQAYFLDHDKDGDLDMYLVNHRYDFKNNSKISSEIQRNIEEITSDQLFRNDGNTFTKISQEAGILNKAWGLSASIGDFNNDDWPDIYVANDYLEPDILYINNKDGTFKNEVLERMNHISFNSMGSDFADINNDMKPDLMVLDMLAEDHSRGKENMATMSTQNFNSMVQVGYHRQYMSNVLQLNKGDGNYSDIGQLAGITKTDWSWAPLIADFDNDGLKDVFITNGIEKDLGNQDFRREAAQLNRQGVAMSLDSVLNMIPGAKLANYSFKNNGDLTFSKSSTEWGLEKRVNSNGAAYADLDNDGDLDLVINNENDIASVYKNTTTNNHVRIQLIGDDKNTFGIGARVKVSSNSGNQYQELFVNRGYLSSVSNILNFGLAQDESVQSIEVVWPDNKVSTLKSISVNETIVIDHKDSQPIDTTEDESIKLFAAIEPSPLNLGYKHIENDFNDFSKQLLLPHKQSTLGPCSAVADINGDGLEDLYLGGAKGQSGSLYIQKSNGSFNKINTTVLNSDRNHEDVGALFFDMDNDGDQDLYVTSGGYEFEENDPLLQDRLYMNNGRGNFTKSNSLPEMLTSTKAVNALDFDKDGDQDIIVGGRIIPGKYPLSPKSYLLQNDNGKFSDVTDNIIPELRQIGMVNAIEVTDHNTDGLDDIVVVGEWMPITIFTNESGKFVKEEFTSFVKSEGWYQSVVAHDFDNDGDEDLVIGNIGANNKFHPTLEKPLHIFSSDFDNNGSYDIALSKVYNGNLVPVRGKECSSEQTPFLNDKIGTYKEFASLNIEGVYGDDKISNANHLQVYNFQSLYIENKGNGNFELTPLPSFAQIGPTMDILAMDVNNDGHQDIIGVGNLYDTEVETVRYDASQGYVLLGNGDGTFNESQNSGLSCNSDMRTVSAIKIGSQEHLLITSNNDTLNLFELVN